MSFFKRLLALFSRRSKWDSLPYGKPAAQDDEWQRLNGER